MKAIERMFVVVDPADSRHYAMERAIKTAKLIHNSEATFKVFVAVDSEAVDTRVVNNNLFRDQSWFESEIRAPFEEAGLDYSIEVSWSSEWQKSIVHASGVYNATRILLPVHERGASTRLFFSESKWDLLKSAQCPVVLIQPGAREDRKKILAAVNYQAVQDGQRTLNKTIIDQAKAIAGLYDAELHVVNAYIDSMHYPDRGRLANDSGIPQEFVHVEEGFTDEAVAKVAKKIDTDLVVMGTLNQKGTFKSRRGNTAERVINALDQDIMVVNY
jgi:universal stress protein E